MELLCGGGARRKMCDEFCRVARGPETAGPISPESVLPIAHYWQKKVSHIYILRAQEFTQANF